MLYVSIQLSWREECVCVCLVSRSRLVRSVLCELGMLDSIAVCASMFLTEMEE